MVNAGYWIMKDGSVERVTNHISYMISYPEKFGITLDFIREVYARTGEPLGQEGEARDDLILLALKKGFVRTRQQGNQWSMTSDVPRGMVAQNIMLWAKSEASRGIAYAETAINWEIFYLRAWNINLGPEISGQLSRTTVGNIAKTKSLQSVVNRGILDL